MMNAPKWPQKMREMESHHFDSTVWNDFKFRDDDIVIATYGKSGTTWMQQIVSQLIFKGEEDLPVEKMSPWVDLRVPPKPVKFEALESQDHRRFVKTHLPVDALVYSQKAKYIYIARDGRDVLWSLYNHHVTANEIWYETINDTPGLVGPPIGKPSEDIRQYYHEWLEKDGFPFWSFWDNIRSWWAIRTLPNILFVHYANLKRDMKAEIERIAAFLDIPVEASLWPIILRNCSFEYMKTHADLSAPLGGKFWHGGAKSFIYKGKNGRWQKVLSKEESEKYEQMAIEKLGLDCSGWLATGNNVYR